MTMPWRAPRVAASLLALGIVACDAPPELAAAFRDDPSPQGTWPPPGGTLNTASLGATPLMRLLPPGSTIDVPRVSDGIVSLIEVLDGDVYRPVTSVSAPQGMLVLEADGELYEGAAVVGSRWWLDDAHSHHVTIAEVSEQGQAFGYQLEHRHGRADATEPVCKPDIDGDHWAYLVEDVLVDISSGTITAQSGPVLVACASGALGKAITWGFSPWSDGAPASLALYQTGVRTVRADYCGDGSPHTQDGVLIQVFNELAGQSFVAPGQSTEAVFGPDGALCVSTPRNEGADFECDRPTCGGNPLTLMTADFHTWTKLAPS
ncbi:MAG: hypothetical protein KDK70_40855 [Myxococcales bacterium]|nr:hypothetical protein [Myxococcales bacterium]